jgi:4-amino-4-deoxy-L-arabinose transferase-like glycosyltransferase
MIGRLRSIAALAVLAFVSAIAGLTALPPLDRDESRIAQASLQMIESGDHVSIQFQDEARNKTPAAINWLQAASVRLFSSPDAHAIWAYRLPSVLGLIIGVIATYGAGCVLVGRKAAFAGAAFLAVAALAGTEAGIARTDAPSMGITTAAMAAMAALYQGRGRGFGVLFWASLAAGILINGLVTPMIAGLTILALVAMDRRVRWLGSLLWWPGPVLAVLITAPWVYFVEKATGGQFLTDAALPDVVAKLIGSQESHGAWPGTHLALLPFLFFPGLLFLVPGIAAMVGSFFRRSDPESAGLRFLAAWTLPAWLVFELLPTKAPHYVLPLYPALAIAAGAAYAALADRKAGVAPQLISTLIFAVTGGAFVVALILLPRFIDEGAATHLTLGQFVSAYGALPTLTRAVAAGIAAALFFTPLVLWRVPQALLWATVACGLILQWTARNIVAPKLEPLWVSARLSEDLEGLTMHPRTSELAKRPLVSAGYSEPSLVFLTDQDTVFTDGAGAARYAAAETGRATIVEARERDAFLGGLRALGASAVVMAEVTGLDYSRGEPVSIEVYRTMQRARRKPAEGEPPASDPVRFIEAGVGRIASPKK